MYIDDGILALDTGLQLLFLDIYDDIPTLEVAGYCDVDVDVGDGLVPLVRQGCLLFGLLGAGSCFLLGGRF